jgi:lysophospholipid acyltransferase (LPLAT)-like uncharacterized protein
MSDRSVKVDYSDVESRRSAASSRRMSLPRRLYYFLGLPVLRSAVRLLWWSYRIEKVIGEDISRRIVAEGAVSAPCYWHQHHLLCTSMIREWIRRGFRACFLVSASVDGEVPGRIARAWGAEVIRGSANQTGALVLRDMRDVLRRGISIVTTADGPNGPKYEFKAGAILMARIAKVPLVPLACAAEKAWYLRRWDDFMIPKPFSRVVLAIGEPIIVPPDTPLDRIEEYRRSTQDAIMSLMEESRRALESR